MRSTRLHAFLVALAVVLAGRSALITGMAAPQNVVYVTKVGSPDPDGSPAKPYHVVEAGIARTLTSPASTVQIAAGKYYETFTTDTPSILQATSGTVTIGKLDYQASTTLEIITLNTHLAGDEVFMPSWQDYQRADDIADFFGGANPRPDVVGFQEIWDEDLFFGGDGANGIRPRSGYPYGDHGDAEGPTLNSGAALMSDYPLANFVQVEWDDCSDDETVSGRLDYIFYFPSLDGSVEIIPTSVEVLPFTGRILTEDGLTTNQSSDHWGVHGQFKLIRP